jgi:hypothetical protein
MSRDRTVDELASMRIPGEVARESEMMSLTNPI